MGRKSWESARVESGKVDQENNHESQSGTEKLDCCFSASSLANSHLSGFSLKARAYVKV